MGEAQRRIGMGLVPKGIKPGQPIQVEIDLKNATPRLCECGCKFFTTAVQLFMVSALLSPTGQELMAQVPALLCRECGTVLEVK